MTSGTNYPWSNELEVLDFSTEALFESFLEDLTTVTGSIYTEHYFNSINSLINLHSKFRSCSDDELEETLKRIPLDECEDMKELSCVGLARVLKETIHRVKPELDPYVGVGVTNEWNLKEDAPESFWMDTNPPSFPELCREHCLLFIKVSLVKDRKAIVFLDPARCFGIPLVVTEDGHPPQSMTLCFERGEGRKENTVSWGGPAFARWIIGRWSEETYTEEQIRVYVGGSFQAFSYMEWFNLLFPFRALIYMEASTGDFKGIHVIIHNTPPIVRFLAQEGDQSSKYQITLTESTENDENESKLSAIKALSDRISQKELKQLIDNVGFVIRDEVFVAKLMATWTAMDKESKLSLKRYTSQPQLSVIHESNSEERETS